MNITLFFGSQLSHYVIQQEVLRFGRICHLLRVLHALFLPSSNAGGDDDSNDEEEEDDDLVVWCDGTEALLPPGVNLVKVCGMHAGDSLLPSNVVTSLRLSPAACIIFTLGGINRIRRVLYAFL